MWWREVLTYGTDCSNSKSRLENLENNPCVFQRSAFVVITYIDDVHACTGYRRSIKSFENEITKCFKMQGFRIPAHFLRGGMKWTREDTVVLHHSTKITNQLLNRGTVDTNHVWNPISHSLIRRENHFLLFHDRKTGIYREKMAVNRSGN